LNLLLENALYFYCSLCISHESRFTTHDVFCILLSPIFYLLSPLYPHDSRCIFTIHDVPKTVGNQIFSEETQFASEENPIFSEETQFASEEEAFARSDDHFACEEDLFARSDDHSARSDDHFGRSDDLFANEEDLFGQSDDLFAREEDLFARFVIFKVCEVNLNPFSNKVFKELVVIKRYFQLATYFFLNHIARVISLAASNVILLSEYVTSFTHL